MNFAVIFFLFFKTLLAQESFYQTSSQIITHIGLRIIDPIPGSLFHIKGSEIVTVFDPFSNQLKSVNYVDGRNLNSRGLDGKPKYLKYYKRDMIIMVYENDKTIYAFNLRYANATKLSNGAELPDEYSVFVSTFLENDYLIAYGKGFIKVMDLQTGKIIADLNDPNLDIKALNYFPEKNTIVMLDTEALIVWKIVLDLQTGKETISMKKTLEDKFDCSCILERIKNTANFLTYQPTGKNLKFWDSNIVQNIRNISLMEICSNDVDHLKSIDKECLIIICGKNNGFLVNITSNEAIYNFTTLSGIVDVTVFDENKTNNIVLLLESGQIDLLSIDKMNKASLVTILKEKEPFIANISEISYLDFHNFFRPENQIDVSGLMAVRSEIPDNKSVHLFSTYEQKYVKSLNFQDEVKQVLKIGFSSYFLIWHGDTFNVYNQTSLTSEWNLTGEIKLLDVVFSGGEDEDFLPENNFVAIYSANEDESLSLYRSNGEFVIRYILPEKCRKIKLFCMFNNFNSWIYFTEEGSMVKVKYSFNQTSNTSAIEAEVIKENIKDIDRCKSSFYNSNAQNMEFYGQEGLKDGQKFSQITPLTYGDFILYDKSKSFLSPKVVANEQTLINYPSKQNHANFKDCMLLMDNHLSYSGYFYNEQESFQLLLEKNCQMNTIERLGVCINNDCVQYLDEYSTNYIDNCPEDSFEITNYLGLDIKACRKCGLEIPGCVQCSSEKNCSKCQNGSFLVGSPDKLNEYQYCYSLDILDGIDSSIFVSQNDKFERCSALFPFCMECTIDKCLACQPLSALNNSQCQTPKINDFKSLAKQDINLKILILAAFAGLVLLIFVMVVLYYACKGMKLRKATKYNEFVGGKEMNVEGNLETP